MGLGINPTKAGKIFLCPKRKPTTEGQVFKKERAAVSKYYTPKLGRLWRRAKRSDRSEGAASPVRHIDPSTYQIPAEMLVPVARKPRRKPFKLLDDADKILLRDAQRRHGKRHRDRVRLKIKSGRYR